MMQRRDTFSYVSKHVVVVVVGKRCLPTPIPLTVNLLSHGIEYNYHSYAKVYMKYNLQ